ncbi:MAG: hypothetical protein K6T65_11310 [Peptococcaceae bacterium]|nr:hypothetical protein [Peptococcaceae bacterium]
MFQKAKGILAELHQNEGGSYFVEMALVLIGVAFVVFNSAAGLATDGIAPKYDDITTRIQGVTVPTLN